MTKKEIIECDTCGKRLSHGNPYSEKGWIIIEGKITTATGIYKTCYQSLWIGNQDVHHFCCLDCFIKHNDNSPYYGHGKECFAIKMAIDHYNMNKFPSINCDEDCFKLCKQKSECTWYGKYISKESQTKKK